jgi:transposase-like protein
MEGHDDSRFFLEPQQTFHRRYEALRAILVDDEPVARVAERFGYKTSALRSMVSRFRADRRRGVTPPFFSPTVADAPAGEAVKGTDLSSRPRRSPTVAS